ncbi:hypothetical protein B4168_3462 [Anoxybacillus flavithermus]|nr:hypothetical protein B4168_3462 [Anoxybacillus flavithermus]OAO84544.1 hypothetical protein GT23_3395 [Parageobacillus thermoglucosidasius]
MSIQSSDGLDISDHSFACPCDAHGKSGNLCGRRCLLLRHFPVPSAFSLMFPLFHLAYIARRSFQRNMEQIFKSQLPAAKSR